MTFLQPIDIIPEYGQYAASLQRVSAEKQAELDAIDGGRMRQMPRSQQVQQRIQSQFNLIPYVSPDKEAAANLTTEEDGPNWWLIGGVALGAVAVIGGGVWWWNHYKATHP